MYILKAILYDDLIKMFRCLFNQTHYFTNKVGFFEIQRSQKKQFFFSREETEIGSL